MRISVLGNNLISRHFVKYLSSFHPTVQISLWTYTNCDDYKEFETVATCFRFFGMKNLPNALLGADVVVNLHECTDFSLTPDVSLLQAHNVEFVRSILFHINSPMIHLSTPFLQCSNRWPNVYEPERDPMVYSAQWPFQQYCASKFEAEMLIKESTNDCYILRCVPTYGDGDECSILTDLIYLSNDKSVYSIGDDDGHMQMAYAGNVAIALWAATCRMLSQSTTLDLNGSFSDELTDLLSSAENSLRVYDSQEKSRKPLLSIIKEDDEDLEGYRARNNTVRTSFESEHDAVFKKGDDLLADIDVFDDSQMTETAGLMANDESMLQDSMTFTYCDTTINDRQRVFDFFLINDDTPKRTIANTFNQMLFSGKRTRSSTQWPFIPLYYIYLLVAIIIRFAVQLFGPIRLAKTLPDPSFLYFYFHHWTFFNSTKSLLMLGYKPDYNFKECVERSSRHYRELRKPDVKQFSWQNSIASR